MATSGITGQPELQIVVYVVFGPYRFTFCNLRRSLDGHAQPVSGHVTYAVTAPRELGASIDTDDGGPEVVQDSVADVALLFCTACPTMPPMIPDTTAIIRLIANNMYHLVQPFDEATFASSPFC